MVKKREREREWEMKETEKLNEGMGMARLLGTRKRGLRAELTHAGIHHAVWGVDPLHRLGHWAAMQQCS